MRKLSMKGKRKNSPESDGEPSDENGVASNARASDDNDGSDDSVSERSDKNTKARRSNKKKRSSRSRGKQEDQVDETVENEEQEKPAGSEENGQKSNSKRRKKEKPAAPTQNEENEEDEYEVEKVVAQRTIKGRRQFLVRWKGYAEDADTWEQEKDLNCPQLIEEFLSEQADEESTEKTPKSTKSKSAKKSPKKAKKDEEVKKDEENEDEDEGEEKEFEVERIIEVHFKKDKSREFLIRWKGFSQNDDTWEPEDHLNCPDLIAKFMEKVESAKKSDRRELRANPSLTRPYTLAAPGKRHSRRHVDKQRVTYQGCDD